MGCDGDVGDMDGRKGIGKVKGQDDQRFRWETQIANRKNKKGRE